MRDARQSASGAKDHPYFSGYAGQGDQAKMPATIGGFRTGEGFDEDYQRWYDMINPQTEQPHRPLSEMPTLSDDITKIPSVVNESTRTTPTAAGKQFQELIDQTGMDPKMLVRALAAERHMEEQQPFLNRATRTAAQEAFDNDPKSYSSGRSRPDTPSFQDRMRAYHSLPEEYQTALGNWQGHQVGNWKQPGYKMPEEFSSSPASIGFSGHPEWSFPAFPENRHKSFDSQGRPEMLDPEQYMGLQEYGDRYGVDFRTKDFRDYWNKQRESYADARKGGREHPSEQWNGPASTVKGYWWDREGRRGKHDFDVREKDPTMLMQRLAGFRRTDPRTGKEVYTVSNKLGQDPGGLAGAFKNTVLGGLSAPATAGISLAEGDPRYAQMGGRSVLSLLNHTMGTDFGHNANHGANPAGMGADEEGGSTNIGRNLATTRGLFNDVYDPLTGQHKPSDFHGVGGYYGKLADDPETGSLGRIASRGMQTTMNKGPDVLYNLALMRAAGIKPSMKNLALMSAGSSSIPNMFDPNSPSPGAGRRVGEAIEGAMLPFSGNPLFPMVGQGVKEIPGSKHYYDTADRLRLGTSANPKAAPWLQRTGEFGAGAMEIAPELLLTRQLGRSGAGGKGLRDLTNFSNKSIAGLSGLAGLGGASGIGTDQDQVGARRAKILERLGLDRPGQMKLEMGNNVWDGVIRDMARGVEIEPARMAEVEKLITNPDKQQTWKQLAGMSPAERSTALQSNGVDGGPNNPFQSQQPAQAGNTPRLGSFQQDVLTPDNIAGVQELVKNMPPQHQAMWSKQIETLTGRYADAYRKAHPNMSPSEIQQLSQKQSVNAIMRQIWASRHGMEKQQSWHVKTAYGAIPPAATPPVAPPPATPQPQPPPPLPPVDTTAVYSARPTTQPTTQPAAQPTTQPTTPTAKSSPDRTTALGSNSTAIPETSTPALAAPAAGSPQQPAAVAPKPTAAGQPAAPAEGGWMQTMMPNFDEVSNFVTQMPDKAREYADQAMGQVKEYFGSNQQEAQNIAQGTPPSARTVQQAADQLQKDGVAPESIFSFLENMSGWEKFGLAAGLGVTALGLVNMVSGEGGIGSMIMTVLGLGGAAYAAAGSGVFGEGAKNLRGDVDRGFGDLYEGGKQVVGMGPEMSPDAQKTMKFLAPQIMKLPDSWLTPILSNIKANNPELTRQFNMASGEGSWGNAAISYIGDISGQRQRMMKDTLGLQPKAQDRLLGLWSKLHNPAKPAPAGAQ